MTEPDTIAAIATASGVGGVGIVRVSGPFAIAVVADALGIEAAALDREVRVGWLRAVDGSIVDQVLAFAMRAPRSFTGEDVAELHAHGGPVNLARALAAITARGPRVAEPGEFTRRAFANGKLDLARAEALLQVIHAGSERAWRLAQANLGGKLGDAARALETRVIEVLAEVEGRIDFPEDDLGGDDSAMLAASIAELERGCARLAAGFRGARAVRDGITVALVGPVNAGKSSLLNALYGNERALVAAEPGTTRDYLEVRDDWDGIAVTLIDTAGTRADAPAIEARGIALGEARAATADVVVVVNASDAGDGAWDDGARFGDRAVVVRSKADLSGGGGAAVQTSAMTGQGLDTLRRAVLAVAGVADGEGSETGVIATERQHAAALAARGAFAAALAGQQSGAAVEIVALELRHGLRALAELRGVDVADRVLDEVFARFCIGK